MLSGAISQALRQHYANFVGHLLTSHQRRVSITSIEAKRESGHDEGVVPSPRNDSAGSDMDQDPGSHGLEYACTHAQL